MNTDSTMHTDAITNAEESSVISLVQLSICSYSV